MMKKPKFAGSMPPKETAKRKPREPLICAVCGKPIKSKTMIVSVPPISHIRFGIDSIKHYHPACHGKS
jgi:hypothetical protein